MVAASTPVSQPPLTPAGGRSPSSQGRGPGLERIVGFTGADLAGAAWLPDEPGALQRAVAADGRPFNGAFVPLVVHDPVLAERTFDAAEWAADLIASGGGRRLGLAPFLEHDADRGAPLTRRQWNHTAAMIERLEELCRRYRLTIAVNDVVGGRRIRSDDGLDSEQPIHYVLDAGNFLSDGFVPAELVSPVLVDADGVDPLPGE